MTPVGRRSRLLVGGLAVLVLGWGLAPAGVPLFDGVGFPDEPYRYVDPGPGQATPSKPGGATAEVVTTGGTNPAGFEIASGEQGPQVSIYVPEKTLEPAAGQTTASITATPEAPDTQPSNGTITGNVYRITSSSGGHSVAIESGRSGTVTLRAPVGFKVIPVIDYRTGPGASWHELQTSKVGSDIFEAPFTSLGDYATVLPTKGVSIGSSGGGASPVIIVIAVVAGILVILLLVRGVRSIRSAPAEGEESESPDD